MGSTKKSQPPAKKLRSASLFGCCVGVLSPLKPLPLKLRLCFLSPRACSSGERRGYISGGVHNHNLSKLYPDFYVAMRGGLWLVPLFLCLCCLFSLVSRSGRAPPEFFLSTISSLLLPPITGPMTSAHYPSLVAALELALPRIIKMPFLLPVRFCLSLLSEKAHYALPFPFWH